MSLSGGGLRAACFHLGLLEVLDQEKVAVEPDPAGGDKRPRYLEGFDYVSAVSGGSYAAGHLASTCWDASADQAAKKGLPRIGGLVVETNRLPRWFWVLGIWFLGCVVQIAKTISLLVALLAVVAWVFRLADAPEVMRFCEVLGFRSDVSRGFLPFWITLGIVLVAYGLRRHAKAFVAWSAFCLSLLLIYSSVYLISSVFPGEGPVRTRLNAAWFHLWFLSLPFVMALGMLVWRRKLLGRTSSLFGIRLENHRYIYLMPLLSVLFCMAGLVTTGDIGFTVPPVEAGSVGEVAELVQRAEQKSVDVTRIGHLLYNLAILGLGVTTIGFLRWRDLIKSAKRVTGRLASPRFDPIYRVIVFVCSYGFLLLLLFVLYGSVARENVSGYMIRREGDPSKALHLSDFKDWDAAWQKIYRDSQNRGGRWNDLAVRLMGSRPGLGPLSLEQEAGLREQLRNLESHTWITRFLPYRGDGYLAGPSQASPTWNRPNVGTIFRVKTEIRNLQELVVAGMISDILSDPGLYLTFESARSGEKKTGKLGADDEARLGNSIEKARYLASMPGARVDSSGSPVTNPAKAPGGAEPTAIRSNNREGLRIYLGDLMRPRDGMNVYASIVWEEDQWVRFQIMLISGAIWLILCGIDVNMYSLQQFYCEHLCKHWLVTGPERSGTGWIYSLTDTYQGMPADSTARRAPLFLLNATVQGHRATGMDPDMVRDLFTFSPVAVGSPETGFWINGLRKGRPHNRFIRRNRLDLGQIVAVSGAFLSPGQVSNPALATVLHLLNIRTGWWVQDPDKYQQEKKQPLTRVLFHLFHSIGIDREGDSRYLLTDGAHVENLGLKALLDRRCSLIVASDCTQGDEDCSESGLQALLDVIRQARIEGIEIGPFHVSSEFHACENRSDCRREGPVGLDILFDRKDTRPAAKPAAEATPAAGALPAGEPGQKAAEKNGAADPPAAVAAAESKPAGEPAGPQRSSVSLVEEHYLFARVRYPDETEGLLAYLRPTLTGDEGDGLLRQPSGSSFPNDPPTDQFFSTPQMQTYRLLGRHIGQRLAGDPLFSESMGRVLRGLSPIPPADPPAPDSSCENCGGGQPGPDAADAAEAAPRKPPGRKKQKTSV